MTTMLYRDASHPDVRPDRVQDIWGTRMEVEVFEDDALDGTDAEGWRAHPNDVITPDAEPSVLDGTVAEVAATLPGLSRDALEALLAAERAGKTRKGVVEAIEGALAALTA